MNKRTYAAKDTGGVLLCAAVCLSAALALSCAAAEASALPETLSRPETEMAKEEGTAEEASQPVCDPGTYIGIGAGVYRSAGGDAADMMIRYYDSAGNFHGEALGGVDHFMGTYHIIPDRRLLETYDGEDCIFLRTEDFGQVCRYPIDYQRLGRASEGQEHVGVLSDDGKQLLIYDRDGQICADLDIDAPPKPSLDGEYWKDSVNLVIYEPTGYLCIRLTQGERSILTAIVREDGTVITDEDPSFPPLENLYGTIGMYLITEDRENGYQIVSPEGDVLYRGAIFHWAGRYDYRLANAKNRADFAGIREDGTWRILDENLEELGRIRDSDLDRYGNLQYAQGTIVGLPGETLGGAVCTEVLTYLRDRVPAAKVPGGWQVPEEMGGFLAEPQEGWELLSFSDSFLLAGSDEKKRILRRSDGQVLCETGRMVYLQNNSFVLEMEFGVPDSDTVIYDENMEELYRCSRMVFPCLEDAYFLYRGPWAGIADARGRWILRELQYDE